MKITIITVGKLKEKYLKQAVDEYAKRLSSYVKIEIVEVSDEKAPENMTEGEKEIVKRKEGERILAKLAPDAYVIALAIEGKMKSSETFATNLEQLFIRGKSHIAFIIGGSLGLSDEVMKRANESLSFSKMTFPHQLMRVILLEQLYRAFRIMRNEPYHK
ncbi:23S rRNA (pseudouridine(1915)-N(3))-methyltransferase RlmH [Fervidibacillus halotolerans]|uniref:Ribosomal RNA large subunit methyltransferase H n=1 Tax=Fervidibacillus halotolerans TaxID=2980027 RepID=A0A9E8M0A9_9BACI|nr:23S rRNA (pseudouridine(1915)-N(3))-methyltransferase RlmH [Fervidibacillus halotolerans]WAA12266.1 23S rRNA (pseudouridine(1915)-N(3))-methyltransferase RlmH [Fervidibacillus halotolerans]